MSHDPSHGFSATKVFIGLFVLTMLEVGWAFLPFATWAVWGGLIVFALWKGFLIFTYFMHMRFEGWIVKGFLLPTIPLMAIVVFAVMPDVSFNKKIKYPVGSMVDARTGEVMQVMDPPRDPRALTGDAQAAPAAGAGR